MFAGQEKSSIDKYAGISSLNYGVFFCSKPKNIDKFVFILPIDLTWKFLMDTKKQFWQPCRNIFDEVEIFFGSKFERHCEFFSEAIFPRSLSWTSNNAILTTLLQWFRRKAKFYRMKAEIDRKIVSLSRETIFCEKLLLTRKRQFWRSFRYNFCCSQVFSAKSAKNEQKYTFHQKDFPLKVNWTKEGNFEKTAEINLLSSKLPPLKNRKWWETCRFSAIWFLFEVLPGQEKSGFMKKL